MVFIYIYNLLLNYVDTPATLVCHVYIVMQALIIYVHTLRSFASDSAYFVDGHRYLCSCWLAHW